MTKFRTLLLNLAKKEAMQVYQGFVWKYSLQVTIAEDLLEQLM